MPAAHKGAISFGLVNIPIQLYRTIQDNDVSFNQLCKNTHQRVRYKKYCPGCEKEIKQEDIVKGYQYEKDKYVIMTSEELEAIKTEKDKTIHILQFASLEEVDDIYYEKNYYAIPDKGAEKAYELLRAAMLSKKVVAIAKTVMGTKETMMALCPQKDAILVKTLFYADEIADIPKDISHPKVTKAESEMAVKLIQSMTQSFDAKKYYDEYQERLKEAIEKKISGKNIVEGKGSSTKPTSSIDLMEALTKSLATQKKSSRSNKRVQH